MENPKWLDEICAQAGISRVARRHSMAPRQTGILDPRAALVETRFQRSDTEHIPQQPAFRGRYFERAGISAVLRPVSNKRCHSRQRYRPRPDCGTMDAARLLLSATDRMLTRIPERTAGLDAAKHCRPLSKARTCNSETVRWQSVLWHVL